jgi:hypothetical protein
VNVLEDPAGMAELERLGVRSVPVLSRGDQYTFGQSTRQIVDFLGLTEKSGPELSTDQLAARVTKFMDAALELIPLMPADRLDTHVPGRPRSYRTLAFHLFRVVDAFLDANENVTLVQAMFREEPAADAGTDALVAYGTKVRDRFRAWWQAGDTAPSKTLQTYYGPQSPLPTVSHDRQVSQPEVLHCRRIRRRLRIGHIQGPELRAPWRDRSRRDGAEACHPG